MSSFTPTSPALSLASKKNSNFKGGLWSSVAELGVERGPAVARLPQRRHPFLKVFLLAAPDRVAVLLHTDQENGVNSAERWPPGRAR
eukprot:m.909868 g.909868  ORF g.909868 m.909868 type:complete len:87 (-) comp60108_c0_seq77:1924-2184(-)